LVAGAVTEEPFHRVNRNRSIEMCSVADGFARVVADPAVDCCERIVGDQLTPSLLVTSGSGMG
jgi:hypothetical protein